MTETPFTLKVPDSELDVLQKKLGLTRLLDELDDSGWDYGVPLTDVKRLVERWKDGFDWRANEIEINKLPQFTRDIEVDGFGELNVHYVHQKSDIEGAIPLLFLHGWPGSFLEAKKILPLLVASTPEHPSFHVVAPSLPGFGFSEAPKKKGFAIAQYAELGHKLMLSLGYKEYVLQGGDLGARISHKQNVMYAHKHVKAWHSNLPTTQSPPRLRYNPLQYFIHLIKPYSTREKAGLALTEQFSARGRGYAIEQSTRPQTIGYSLSDSPVGLLAWIYEKLVDWSDDYPWTDDEVLQWVSVYWFSRAGPAASSRIYYEATAKNDYGDLPWTSVPLGFSFFPKELRLIPRTWSRAIGNVVFESEHDGGGHFAAHEKPDELVSDLRKMFGKGGPAFGVVSGKNGYAPA